MIRIGLTRFDEHSGLTGKPKSTLYEYASYLPLVELDTAYYAIDPKIYSINRILCLCELRWSIKSQITFTLIFRDLCI